MRVSTTSTSTISLTLPYACRCAYCGAAIQGEEKVQAEGHAFTGGYATGAQGEMMKLAASLRANAILPFEVEYAEKRLAHYRHIVESGKLREYLETGKKHKEDYFRVDPNSPLGNYLLHGPNKTPLQAGNDRTRMSAYPYNWRTFDKKSAVKCPACGRTQPWCEAVDGESAGLKAFFLGFGVSSIAFIPFMAGLKLPEQYRLIALVPILLWIASSILFFKALRGRQLKKLAALPWNADDLPRYDEAVLAQARQQMEQAGQAGLTL